MCVAAAGRGADGPEYAKIKWNDATRAILRTSRHIGVLVITMFDDDDSVFAAMQAGARGYLLKGASQEETLRAIHAVGSGEAIFSQGIAKKLIQYFSSLAPGAAAAPLFPELTEREREIFRLRLRSA